MRYLIKSQAPITKEMRRIALDHFFDPILDNINKDVIASIDVKQPAELEEVVFAYNCDVIVAQTAYSDETVNELILQNA